MSATGRASANRGFTLVELVIAITVLGILTGIAIPAIDSAQRERQARAPINELYSMAREVRLRAMTEKRPYQIVFDNEGFRASRFFQPYGGREEFEQLKLELEQLDQRDAIMEASRARGIQMVQSESGPELETIEEGLRYAVEYDLESGLRYKLKFWDETDWVDMTGGEFRRWIFQPSGMCEPLKVQMEADDAFFEIEFHPLTADIKRERSWVE